MTGSNDWASTSNRAVYFPANDSEGEETPIRHMPDKQTAHSLSYENWHPKRENKIALPSGDDEARNQYDLWKRDWKNALFSRRETPWGPTGKNEAFISCGGG